MAQKTQQAVYSFTAGVLTPRVSGRADSPKFTSALLTGENWIITPQGGAIYRQGFEFIELSNQGRLFQFHQGGNESDIIIEVLPTSTYGAGDFHFHGDSTISIPSLLNDHSYNSTDLMRLYFTNQERWGILASSEHPPIYLELVDQNIFTATELLSSKVPTYDFDDKNSPSAASGIDATYTSTFTPGTDSGPWADGQLFWLSYDGVIATDNSGEPQALRLQFNNTTPADTVAEILRGLDAISALQGLGTTYDVISNTSIEYETLITGKNAGRVFELIPYQVGGTDRTIITITESTAGAGLEPAWSFPTYVLHNAVYYQCIVPHRSETATNEPPNVAFWTDVGGTAPDTFAWQYPTENDWVTDKVYSPEGRGFPTVAVFHEQRLIFAATRSVGTAMWGSRIGIYDDFNAGVNSADPFAFTLDSSDTPTIKWMASQLTLVAGTSSGDWAIDAEISLGPSDISAAKQNNARSDHTSPIQIDTDIFYIEHGQTKLRMTRYQRNLLGLTSIDVSIIAEHLLHEGIKRVVLLRTPEVLIVALRNDGALIAMTYGQDIGAWVELTSQGFVEDISAYYSIETNEDSLFVTIAYNFDPQGPNQFQFEHMPYPSRTMTPRLQESDPSLTDQDIVLLDSWIDGTIIAADQNTITGLEHLEGQTVAALVNDAWTGEYLVNNGQITLDDANISGSEPYEGTYAVGLLYKGILDTFEIASGNERGVALGTKRKWSRLFVRLLDSALPIINGVLPPDRTPETEMNIAEILRMGLQDVEIRGAGFGNGSINIEQDRPYPTQVIGLWGEFVAGND